MTTFARASSRHTSCHTWVSQNAIETVEAKGLAMLHLKIRVHEGSAGHAAHRMRVLKSDLDSSPGHEDESAVSASLISGVGFR